MPKTDFVDFRQVKGAVTIRMALEHYGVNWLRKSGKELRGRCPIHKGDGGDAFYANEEKNAFHCFSCDAKGNVLDFVAAMENCTVRDSALKLSEWFGVPSGPTASGQADRKGERGTQEYAKEGSALAVEVE